MGNLFGIKASRYMKAWVRSCKTPGMTLWVALQLVNPRIIHQRNPTKEEYKEAVKSAPIEITDCRCKDCRYYRLVKK